MNQDTLVFAQCSDSCVHKWMHGCIPII